jgi:hypothetical protein
MHVARNARPATFCVGDEPLDVVVTRTSPPTAGAEVTGRGKGAVMNRPDFRRERRAGHAGHIRCSSAIALVRGGQRP